MLQQKFRQGGQDMIRLGDSTVPYNELFRLMMITKLPNPDYAPEVQARRSKENVAIFFFYWRGGWRGFGVGGGGGGKQLPHAVVHILTTITEDWALDDEEENMA